MKESKRALIALLLVLPASKAQAGYGSHAAVAYLGGMATIALTATSAGGVLTTFGGSPGAVGVSASMLLAGGVFGTVTIGSIHRELALQLKLDHDTWLTGGEMTPFLQGVYREIRTRSHEFDLEDGEPAGNRIDDRKMTQAIDRLVAMTEGSAP